MFVGQVLVVLKALSRFITIDGDKMFYLYIYLHLYIFRLRWKKWNWNIEDKFDHFIIVEIQLLSRLETMKL